MYVSTRKTGLAALSGKTDPYANSPRGTNPYARPLVTQAHAPIRGVKRGPGQGRRPSAYQELGGKTDPYANSPRGTNPYVRAQPVRMTMAHSVRGVKRGPGSGRRPLAMGDVICLEGDCTIGASLVQEMQATFMQLSGTGKDTLDDSDVAFTQKFGTTVTQIIESYQTENAKLVRQIPFSLVCCAIKELGRKAQDMTTQMRAFRNVSTPSPTPVSPPFNSPGAGLGDSLNTIIAIAAVGLAAVIILPMLGSHR